MAKQNKKEDKNSTANKIVYVCVAFAIMIGVYFLVGLLYIQFNPNDQISPYVKCCSDKNMSYIAVFGEAGVPEGMYCLKVLSNQVIPIKSVCPKL